MSFNIMKEVQKLDNFVIRDINLDRVTSVKRVTMLGGYKVAPIYDDWRDTLTRYYLYLPFCGTVELENYKVLNKTLSIDCLFDVRTGNIKFYCLADECLITTATGSCRVDFPVSATNPVSKAQEIRQGANNIVSWGYDSIKSIGGSIKQGQKNTLGSMLNGGADLPQQTIANGGSFLGAVGGSLVSGIQTVPQALYNIHKPSPTTFSGSYSGGTSIDDPLDFYLYMVVPSIEYDDGILANYGRPCNTWATIGSQSGYIKCDDVKITGDIPQEHKAQLINDLTRGIYHV